MFGKHTKQNLLNVRNAKPSLLIGKSSINGVLQGLSVTLYIDNKDEYSDFEVLGYMQISKLESCDSDQNIFSTTGTVGAYTGFGSLIYQSVLIELKRADSNAILISDRECITEDAENIYKKMLCSNCIAKVPLTPASQAYSASIELDIFDLILKEANLDPDTEYFDYCQLVLDGKINPYCLNYGFSWAGSDSAEELHDELTNNCLVRSLQIKQVDSLIEESLCLGEWASDKRKYLKKIMLDGFAIFRDSGKEHSCALA